MTITLPTTRLTLPVLFLLMGSQGALPADTPVGSAGSDNPSGAVETVPVRAAISSAASEAMREITRARRYLQGDDADRKRALEALEHADQLLDGISASLPAADLEGRIWTAARHLDYEGAQEVLPDLIPLFSSLSEIIDEVPREQAHRQLDLAREALQHGREEEAKQALETAGDALLYVEADLPLKSTRQRVDEAQQAILQGDIDKASASLTQAQRDVVTISLSLQSPLTQAKRSLAQGWRACERGEDREVAGHLADARLFLRQAVHSEDHTTRKGAWELLHETETLEQPGKIERARYRRRLEAAAQRIAALSERAAERIDSGWDRLHGMQAVKQDLIETKLRLAYARIDDLILDDEAAAKLDLSDADAYLGSARTEAIRTIEPRLQQLSLDLAGLARSLEERDPSPGSADYEQLQRKLVGLISGL